MCGMGVEVNWFFDSIFGWVPGIKLRSLGFLSKCPYSWATRWPWKSNIFINGSVSWPRSCSPRILFTSNHIRCSGWLTMAPAWFCKLAFIGVWPCPLVHAKQQSWGGETEPARNVLPAWTVSLESAAHLWAPLPVSQRGHEGLRRCAHQFPATQPGIPAPVSAVWLQTASMTSLGLSFPTCKAEIIGV